MFCLYSGDIWSNALINGLPQEGGGGQPTGNLTFSVFKGQFPHPWVSILSQIPISGANDRHSQQSLLQHWVSPEKNKKWWQNNGTHKLCIFPQVYKTYSGWIFSVAGNLTNMLSAILPKVPLNCFRQCLQQCKMCNAIPYKTCRHQEGLMTSKGWCFVAVVQNFIKLDILSILANLTQNSSNRSCLFVWFFDLSFY